MGFNGVESAEEEIARVTSYFNATPEEQAKMREEAKRIARVIRCEQFVQTALLEDE